MPKVSIIIPNYNHSKFLEERIQSCINQTFRDFEIIILDDCSTDNSKCVIENYREHPKVSGITYNERNSKSTFSQWKKGISLAKGKYIWIAESDDFAEPEFIELLIKPLDNDETVTVSYCRSFFAGEDGNNLGLCLHADILNKVKWTKDYIESGHKEYKQYLKYRNTIPNASSVLFRKTVGIDAIIRTDMRFCGDWYFWIQMLQGNAKIAYNARPLNHFRMHSNTTRFIGSVSKKETEVARFREYRQFVPMLYFNLFDDKYRWMMNEWIDRTNVIFKSTIYQYFPLLHPALVFRYYMHTVKHIFKKVLFNA